MKKILLVTVLFVLFSCNGQKGNEVDIPEQNTPFIWEGANLYFLLTDRFNNGDTANDLNFDRNAEPGKLRGFEGGDIKGITQKINEGYFTELGVNAIWLSPIVEQIHGATDEGTGLSYGFHGYWTKDWTALDPNYGTKEDLHELVETAHNNGIRIVLDAVINHTGPVTEKDPVWPESWVRTGPPCNYQDYESTVTCTLVKNLPDIRTEDNGDVSLPPQLISKWKKEGRYEKEMAELDAFFERTGYPRAPRFYIIKWLTDFITEFGIDGYRADTVKHTEEGIWNEFKKECDFAFSQWKKNNPEKVLDKNDFYLVGEVYNYVISGGKQFDFGDKNVDYFDNGFHSLINFEFKSDAKGDYETIFSKYSNILHKDLKGYGTLNYVSSHDDGQPFDPIRAKSFEAGTKLLLSPGTSQTFYGDEIARPLIIEGAIGDANLRSNMNWQKVENDSLTKEVLWHWRKLGKFRNNHPSIGAGMHKMISKSPYIFQRTFQIDNYKDSVIIGLDLEIGVKEINVSNVFKNGTALRDAYSGLEVIVRNGKVKINSPYRLVLLEQK